MSETEVINRAALVDVLEETLKKIEALPPMAKYDYVTHADLALLMSHLVAIFKAPE